MWNTLFFIITGTFHHSNYDILENNYSIIEGETRKHNVMKNQ